MLQVGTRELKNRLGKYLRMVKEGKPIIITERGTPIARIEKHVLRDDATVEEKLQALAAEGWVTLPKVKGPLKPFTPIRMKGKPLSRMIIEDRRKR